MGTTEQRKLDHLRAALAQSPTAASFTDFHLVHRCLPEASLKEVDLRVSLFGFSLAAPVYINAMTGGFEEAERINEILGAMARDFNLPVAVGSQSIALRDKNQARTFKSVRKRNPRGPVWANLGAGQGLAAMLEAVEMINADGLQLHLNAPQELAMPEGDRNFTGWLDNISLASKQIGLPIIAKEVGFGISREDAAVLEQCGVSAIDVGGSGGTDFLSIEQLRNEGSPPLSGITWGIPTPVSIVESIAKTRVPILASGGVDTPLRAAICLALGAKAVGLGRVILKALVEGGEEGARSFLQRFLRDLRLILCMQGCQYIDALWKRPVVITGTSREWLGARGLEPDKYANRQ